MPSEFHGMLRKRLCAWRSDLGATLVVVQNGKTFTTAINADIEHMLSYGDPLPTVVPELTATLEVLPTNMKMIAYLQDDFFASAERVFQDQVGEQVNIFRSVPYYLEFSSKRASKGAALRRVADLLSVPSGGDHGDRRWRERHQHVSGCRPCGRHGQCQ